MSKTCQSHHEPFKPHETLVQDSYKNTFHDTIWHVLYLPNILLSPHTNVMPPVLIPATCSPTTTETSALAALVPAAIAPSTSTATVLDEALALCRSPDVLSFLFTEDNIQLPYLTSPSLFSKAITGTITSTRVEPDQSRTCKVGPLSDFVTGKWVFIPSFSVSGVTMGFGMHEFKFSPADAWGEHYMMHLNAEFRFVRNDVRSEMLILHDIPDMNACCMEYSRVITPTCQSRTSICLFRDRLHQAAKSGYLDRANILPCLDQINTIYEYRSCPTCRRSHADCLCTLQVTPAKHAFDHTTFVQNMSQRLGTFEGVANVFCYDAGKFKRKSALGSRSTLRGGVDHQLIRNMRDWAVALHINGTETPLQTIAAPVVETSQQATTPSGEHTDEIDLSVARYAESASFWLGDDDPLNDDPFSDLPPLDNMEEQLVDFSSMTRAINWKLPEGLPVNTDEVSDEFKHDPAERREHVPLLDVTGTAGATFERSSNRSHGKSTDDGLAKMLKAEMRRKRNREAAHRSNMKKKAINDKLKVELQTNKEKADSLRMRELALRQENMRLRLLIAESAA